MEWANHPHFVGSNLFPSAKRLPERGKPNLLDHRQAPFFFMFEQLVGGRDKSDSDREDKKDHERSPGGDVAQSII